MSGSKVLPDLIIGQVLFFLKQVASNHHNTILTKQTNFTIKLYKKNLKCSTFTSATIICIVFVFRFISCFKVFDEKLFAIFVYKFLSLSKIRIRVRKQLHPDPDLLLIQRTVLGKGRRIQLYLASPP